MSASSDLRAWLAALPRDASNDAHGAYKPRPEEMYTPDRHAHALMPENPIVAGARGAGKSYWSGVLLDADCLAVARQAYPKARLERLRVQVGFSGQKGQQGVDKDKLDAAVPVDDLANAKRFWWATVLRAVALERGEQAQPPAAWLPQVHNGDYEALLDAAEAAHSRSGTVLVVVFDAIDTVATTWPRRRLLTQALLEVVWEMRAWPNLRPKLFIRRDQLDDDAMHFVELPKLRAGAINLEWRHQDLYGMLFTRMYMGDSAESLHELLGVGGTVENVRATLRESKWPLRRDETVQREAMTRLAGPFMAAGPNGKKKGTTYDWPLKHLADAHGEITPRAFLTLLVAAAGSGHQPDVVLPPTGVRLEGLREASKVRVDQLHAEYLWIKSALAPLAGILLPATHAVIHKAWRVSGTVDVIARDAKKRGFLPPFGEQVDEAALADAMCRIGVMQRREPSKLDMPDLFRVAAKLLKKGATAPA
jgi:hypothetical protein